MVVRAEIATPTQTPPSTKGQWLCPRSPPTSPPPGRISTPERAREGERDRVHWVDRDRARHHICIIKLFIHRKHTQTQTHIDIHFHSHTHTHTHTDTYVFVHTHKHTHRYEYGHKHGCTNKHRKVQQTHANNPTNKQYTEMCRHTHLDL